MLLSQVNYAQSKESQTGKILQDYGHGYILDRLCAHYYGIRKVEENIQKTEFKYILSVFFLPALGRMKYYSLWLQIFYVCMHTHFRRDNIPWASWYFTWSPRSYEGHPKILLQHSQHWLLFMDRFWDLSCWTCQTLTQMNWYAQKATSLLFHDLASSWSWEKKASRLFVSIKKKKKKTYKNEIFFF